MPKKRLIEELELEYERWLTHTVTPPIALRISRALVHWMESFPHYSKPEEWLKSDLQDYAFHLLYIGRSEASVALSLGYIRAFYNWMRQHKELPVANPAAGLPRNKSVPIPELPLAKLVASGLGQVLVAASQGGPDKKIAQQLNITQLSYRAKLRALCAAIGAKNLREAKLMLARLQLRLGQECLVHLLSDPPPSDSQSVISRLPMVSAGSLDSVSGA